MLIMYVISLQFLFIYFFRKQKNINDLWLSIYQVEKLVDLGILEHRMLRKHNSQSRLIGSRHILRLRLAMDSIV